jgi:hypothetical protein
MIHRGRRCGFSKAAGGSARRTAPGAGWAVEPHAAVRGRAGHSGREGAAERSGRGRRERAGRAPSCGCATTRISAAGQVDDAADGERGGAEAAPAGASDELLQEDGAHRQLLHEPPSIVELSEVESCCLCGRQRLLRWPLPTCIGLGIRERRAAGEKRAELRLDAVVESCGL